jgi:hypothetical protein
MLSLAQSLAKAEALAPLAAAEAPISAPSATLFAACIAAAAAITAAVMNYRSQVLLRSIDNTNKIRERSEDRAQRLLNEYVSPFFAELTRNSRLAAEVSGHLHSLKSCPLSAPFKRRLLTNSGVVHAWGDAAVSLSDHRARILLALPTSSLNAFVGDLNALIQQQMKVVVYLIESYDFSDKDREKFDADYKKVREHSARLFASTIAAIHAPSVEDDNKINLSVEGLDGAIFWNTPLKLKFQYAKGESSWSVWWTVPRPSDPQSKVEFESFCSERDRFQTAVASLDGVLATGTENAEGEDQHHSRVTVLFASQSHLDKFVNLLPELKVQTKALWIGPASAQELIA